jgi:choline dehydrogenase-like flavoprotein
VKTGADSLLAQEHDVIVVGSGAAGGMAAHALSQAGIRVLMLEAGRDYDPLTETPMFNLPTDAPLRADATPDKEFGFFDATVDGGWQMPGEPYVVAEGSRFKWWRARMLGGRTNHWGRLSFRFGPHDFKGHSADGLGVDWPVSYDEMAPWYDRVERLIGVFGDAEGIENSPDSPPGILQPPPKPRAYEAWMQMAMGRLNGIRVVPAHAAVLTQPLGDRPACFYATDCLRGCAIRANFQSTTVLIPPSRATGRLTVRTGAMVFKVLLDGSGRAAGVQFIDRDTGAIHQVRARAVVLGASACESARILMQSAPGGLANGSGQLGRNLMDSVGTVVGAEVPQLQDLPAFNDDGVSVAHVYAPWWLHREQVGGKLPFSRGYHIEFGGGRGMPSVSSMRDVAGWSRQTGAGLHADVRRTYGSAVYMGGRGTMLPNAESFCELDSDVKDRWGLPALRFHFRWGAEELAQAAHQRDTFRQVFEAMGARILTDLSVPIADAISTGGEIIHEVGTARMGASATNSVLDPWCQAWDVPNLYVVDGAAFPTNPDKNPTLTILALAWRAMDHLAGRMKRGEA